MVLILLFLMHRAAFKREKLHLRLIQINCCFKWIAYCWHYPYCFASALCLSAFEHSIGTFVYFQTGVCLLVSILTNQVKKEKQFSWIFTSRGTTGIVRSHQSSFAGCFLSCITLLVALVFAHWLLEDQRGSFVYCVFLLNTDSEP